MSSPANCCNSCETPETVNIPGPEGEAGADGAPGTDGINAFTETTANFNTPLEGQNVAISVENSEWMTVGQVVIVEGPAHFEVISKPTNQSFTGQYLDYEGDIGSGQAIASGSTVSPSGVQPELPTVPDAITAFGAGSAYSLTTTPAAINLGTTDPAIVLTTAGDWLLWFTVRVDYNGATFADEETATFTLRRTNNTPANITNGSYAFLTQIITTLSHTAAIFTIGPIPYSTTNTDDALTIFASISDIPSAGSIDVVSANIAATYVQT